MIGTTHGTSPVGRLSAAQRGNQTASYDHDLRGNLSGMTDVALPRVNSDNTIKYQYNADNQITNIAYSDYRNIQYLYDLAGNISLIRAQDIDNHRYSTTGYNVTRTLASNITHLPFGPISHLVYGNGMSMDKQYDQDYRLSHQTTNGQAIGLIVLDYSYTQNGNLSGIDEVSNHISRQYQYDRLNRLTNINTLSPSGTTSQSYGYDNVGNRKTLDQFSTMGPPTGSDYQDRRLG